MIPARGIIQVVLIQPVQGSPSYGIMNFHTSGGEYQKRDSSFDTISQTTESSVNVNITFTRDNDEIYFTCNFMDSIIPLLVNTTINYDGNITQFAWSDTKQQWDISWTLWFDLYNRCGAWSIYCDESCSCLMFLVVARDSRVEVKR
ncbi:hypothetical protein QJS04_geneDACA003234 [Acorus gramineus]|uniref:S-locus glycoprotein domain-containing protein n=1 Tax=Acorus gramineus TaxID=55184 RepID=A0AAV9BWU2_ACOGR|nr:hypothetical protein QJS04_geneDACA003234 [Acorus gramineus]